MTDLQKIQLKLSKSREQINELAAKANRTDDETAKLAELRAAHSTLETEYRTALENSDEAARREHRIENGAQTPEQRQFFELEDSVHVPDFLSSSVEGSPAEYRTELGMTRGIPYGLLLTPEERVEMRADAVSTPPGVVQVNQGAILNKLTEEGVLTFLGVSTPSVAPGTAAFPVVTGSANVGVVDKGAALESTAVAIGASNLSPVRLQSRISWDIESEYSMPQFRQALQTEMRRVIREQFDKLAVNGKAAAPAVDGFTRTLADPTDPTAVANMGDLVRVFVPTPPWSSMTSEPRMLANRDAIEHFMTLVTAQGSLDWDRLVLTPSGDAVGRQIRASNHVAAASGNIARAIRFAGPRGAGRAVMPVWADGLLIEDLVTDSAAGQRHATLIALANFKIVDASPWSIIEFKLA